MIFPGFWTFRILVDPSSRVSGYIYLTGRAGKVNLVLRRGSGRISHLSLQANFPLQNIATSLDID